MPPSVIVQLFGADVKTNLPATPAAVYFIVPKVMLKLGLTDRELHPLYIALRLAVE